jgi:hypothetical protein
MTLFSCHPFWAPSTSPIYPVLFPLFLPSVLSPSEDLPDRPSPFPTAFSVFCFLFTQFPLYSPSSIQHPHLSLLFSSSCFLHFSCCFLIFSFLFPPLPIFSVLFPLLPQFSFLMPFYLFFLLPLALFPLFPSRRLYIVSFFFHHLHHLPCLLPDSLPHLFLPVPVNSFPPLPSPSLPFSPLSSPCYNLSLFLELLVQRNTSNSSCRIIHIHMLLKKKIKITRESSSGQLPGTGNPLVIIPGVIGNTLAL